MFGQLKNKFYFCKRKNEKEMTREEKELLIRDLCPRLKYRVKCASVTTTGEINTIGGYCEVLDSVFIKEIDGWVSISMIKPYLRPMESMTEEEKNDLRNEHIKDEQLFTQCIAKSKQGDNTMRGKVFPHFAADWCNKNHFDYRGLIPMRLALPAKEGMYTIK